MEWHTTTQSISEGHRRKLEVSNQYHNKFTSQPSWYFCFSLHRNLLNSLKMISFPLIWPTCCDILAFLPLTNFTIFSHHYVLILSSHRSNRPKNYQSSVTTVTAMGLEILVRIRKEGKGTIRLFLPVVTFRGEMESRLPCLGRRQPGVIPPNSHNLCKVEVVSGHPGYFPEGFLGIFFFKIRLILTTNMNINLSS